MKKIAFIIIIIITLIVALLLINMFLNSKNTTKPEEVLENSTVNAIAVTNENFEEEVLNSQKPVLVDFYANWCEPCKKSLPIIEEVAKENNNIKVVTINIDEAKKLKEQYEIKSIPTLVLIQNGKETARQTGFTSKSDILELIK